MVGPRVWPSEMMAHVPPGYAEQQAQAAFMQQFTTMIASAAAAGAMAAIQAYCPGAASPMQAQAVFCAAANGAASMAAARATELVPSAFPRHMASSEHCARARAPPPGIESNLPFVTANQADPPANGAMGATATAATTAAAAAGQQSSFPTPGSPRTLSGPRLQSTVSLPDHGNGHKEPNRSAMASDKASTGGAMHRDGTGEQAVAGNHEAVWPQAPVNRIDSAAESMLAPHEATLIKRVQVYAWIVCPLSLLLECLLLVSMDRLLSQLFLLTCKNLCILQ
jgi:hypothetical protein